MYLGTAGYKNGGKLIDEWSFNQPFHGADRAAPYRIEVYMRKRHTGAGTSIQSVIEFIAQCPALPESRMVNSDIEVLRVAVEDHLREQAILSSGVNWEDWLEVIVQGGKRKYGSPVDGEELVIEYKKLRRGRHPDLPGRDYTINNNHVAVKFPTGKKTGTDGVGEHIDLGPNSSFRGHLGDGRNPDGEYSYIPDTPANRAALDGLIGSLRTLRSRLSDFLGQAGIERSLVIMQSKSGLLALTGDTDHVGGECA